MAQFLIKKKLSKEVDYVWLSSLDNPIENFFFICCILLGTWGPLLQNVIKYMAEGSDSTGFNDAKPAREIMQSGAQ